MKSDHVGINMSLVILGLTFLLTLSLFVVSNSYAADIVIDASHVVNNKTMVVGSNVK